MPFAGNLETFAKRRGERLVGGQHRYRTIRIPLTPQLSYNPSNNRDNRNPVRPFVNPDFSGPVVLGKPGQWFNPEAFIAPPSTIGFYGDLGRNAFTGPGFSIS